MHHACRGTLVHTDIDRKTHARYSAAKRAAARDVHFLLAVAGYRSQLFPRAVAPDGHGNAMREECSHAPAEHRRADAACVPTCISSEELEDWGKPGLLKQVFV